jgi:GNAT superfamily N-acetyltransferase
MSVQDWQRGEFEVSANPQRLDVDAVHQFLAQESYWAKGIPRATFEKSVRNSLCFGLFHGNRQIGFARVISDFATIAYLGDVFVTPPYRGQGLAKWLMECVVSHPELQNLRRWILLTRDAHGLYRHIGFTELAQPERWMEIHNAGTYGTAAL